MKSPLWTLTAFTLALGIASIAEESFVGQCTADEESEIEKEQKRLEGKWIVQEYVHPDGKKIFPEEETTWTFKFDTICVHSKTDGEYLISFKLNPSANPKSMDCTPLEGDDKDKVFGEIYKIEGDTLTTCGGTESTDPRPTEFRESNEFNHCLVILKRSKL